MDTLKLLIVEDDDEAIETCKSSAERYTIEKGRKVKIVESKTLELAKEKIDNSFDGAIIDLKLANEGDEGNEVISHIRKSFRIPIIVFTGTPMNVEADQGLIKVCKKGEVEYGDLFDLFYQIFDTGLTKILGGRGIIEEAMNTIFWETILPVVNDWKRHVLSGKETEKALLRFVVNHLLGLLDEEGICFPEEMYTKSLRSDSCLETGQIVRHKAEGELYIILSPACDLALHDGEPKTDRILLCGIEKRNFSLIRDAKKSFSRTLPDEATDEDRLKHQAKQAKHEKRLTDLIKNNYTAYYHFLPKTSLFEGGFINFRKVHTYKHKEFDTQVEVLPVLVSRAFTKDIIARFSAYYARQGQPDFDFGMLMAELKAEE